jgi:hypothetical protein
MDLIKDAKRYEEAKLRAYVEELERRAADSSNEKR